MNETQSMINQRHCPFCKSPAEKGCAHLALAVEARDFVRRCIERSHGEIPWKQVCQQRRQGQPSASGSSDAEDFTWLETAFCERFLKRSTWFGGMDHEWRSGPRSNQGGFWVLLWSKDPRKLWWALRDELERQASSFVPPATAAPWLIHLSPQ